MNLHWHEEAEIIFLERGEFRVDINMERYWIKSLALLFVVSGDIHGIYGEEGCRESAVVFDMKMLTEAGKESPAARMRVKAYLPQMFAGMYEAGKLSHTGSAADDDGKKIENVKGV